MGTNHSSFYCRLSTIRFLFLFSPIVFTLMGKFELNNQLIRKNCRFCWYTSTSLENFMFPLFSKSSQNKIKYSLRYSDHYISNYRAYLIEVILPISPNVFFFKYLCHFVFLTKNTKYENVSTTLRHLVKVFVISSLKKYTGN